MSADDRDLSERFKAEAARIAVPPPAERRTRRPRTLPIVALAVVTVVLALVVGTALPELRRAAERLQRPAGPPAAPAPADARYGIAVADGPQYWLRRETDGALVGRAQSGAISPDGRYVAYFAAETRVSLQTQLFVASVTDPERRRKVTELGGERFLDVIWSSDGLGLAVVVGAAELLRSVFDRPPYAALRTIDLTTGQIRERARFPDVTASVLAWDRSRDVLAAVTLPWPIGPPSYVVAAGETLRVLPQQAARTAGIPLPVAWQASSDARYVLGAWHWDDDSAGVRYWPIDDLGAARDVPLAVGERIIGWRPGSHDLFVADGEHLVLLSLDGQRRTRLGRLPHPIHSAVTPRFDGSAVYVRDLSNYHSGPAPTSAVHLIATDGRSTVLPIEFRTAPRIYPIHSVDLRPPPAGAPDPLAPPRGR